MPIRDQPAQGRNEPVEIRAACQQLWEVVTGVLDGAPEGFYHVISEPKRLAMPTGLRHGIGKSARLLRLFSVSHG